MADPTKALHKALLAALKSACSVEIYDGVPQNVDYPCVTMDYMTSDNDDFTNARMDERYAFLHIWSRNHGQAEILGIMEEIDTLNDTDLTLDTGDVGSLRVMRKRTTRENDNLTFRGQVVLRIITTY